jgi:NAD(P)-dependent dehydrogenase (short-subunit alcohol dehydrogenase family)
MQAHASGSPPAVGRLAGKRAIITGGGHGIGRATAIEFVRQGSKVAIIDADEVGCTSVAREIDHLGGSCLSHVVDVSNPDEVDRTVTTVAREFDAIDILFNNAGIMPEGTALTTDIVTWQRVIDVNLTAMYLTARAVLPHFPATGGSIINTASVQALLGHPNRLAYVTSKHGVVGLTRALAADHAPAKIRVNAICPGTIDTPMLHRELEKVPAGERDTLLQSYRDLHPIGDIGQAEDVAHAVVFLASDESRFITGAVLAIDGGYTSLITHA